MERRKIWIREELIFVIPMLPGAVLDFVLSESKRRCGALILFIGFTEITVASIIQYILEEKVKQRLVRDENDMAGVLLPIILFELIFLMFYGGNAILWNMGAMPLFFDKSVINNLFLSAAFTIGHIFFVMIKTGRGELFQLKDDEEK